MDVYKPKGLRVVKASSLWRSLREGESPEGIFVDQQDLRGWNPQDSQSGW